MTDLNDPSRNYRRTYLAGPPRDVNTLRSPSPADQPDGMASYVPGRTPTRPGNSVGEPPSELIAHLVIALSRYRRHVCAEGGRIPAQIEDLITFLAHRVRAVHDLPILDPWSATPDPSAMPRRLLVTKSEAAEQLGVSLRTIERLISAGRLPLVHVEGAARVRVTDLEAYVRGLDADGRPPS